jgi:DNA-binding PucR family transcriptional regulator
VVGDLSEVVGAVAEAQAALLAVPAWAQAPRPVASSQVLAERVVLGDDTARRRLVEEVWTPLVAARGELLPTAAAYLEEGGAVEGTARRLFLHPNTVRYRLARIRQVVGRDLTVEREAQEVRLALVLGRAGTPSAPS